MDWIKKILGFEAKRFLRWWKVIILLFFYLITVYFIQSGINQYRGSSAERKVFQEYEKIRVENFQYYAQYGTYGFRLIYIPGPLSAFTGNAGVISSNINAFIDAGERMNIYESFQGKNPFKGYISIFLNLTGFILLFYSLATLCYGMEAYKGHEFIKFIERSIGSREKTFWMIFAARFILLLGYCLFVTLSAWLLFIINGLVVDAGKLIIYFTVVSLMLAFFLVSGMITGTLKSISGRIAAIVLIWIVFIFCIPAAVEKIVYNRAESIKSTYQLEIEKFKLMMEIEKKAKDQAGKLDVNNPNTPIRQQLYEYFVKNEFKDIFDHERAMIDEMKGVVSLHHNLSLIFPTTFFKSVSDEVGGRGYENLILFYEKVLKLKEGFLKYYAEKSFYSGEKTVTPFLKGEENIYYAPGLLPGNFSFGIVFPFFWLLVLLYILWVRFNRVLDRTIETEKELSPEDIKKNKTNVIFTTDKGLLPHLISKLSFQKISFVSVPCLSTLPGDTKVKNLLSLFDLEVPETLGKMRDKYIYDLELDDKGRVLTEIIRSLKADIIIFNNFLAGLSDELIVHFADVIKPLKEGRAIVYFTNSMLVTALICDCGFKWKDEKMAF